MIFPVPGDAVKGKTWGPSTASAHVKQRPTIVPEREQARWKASSAPSLEKSPRNLVNVPSVGTVPEGEKSLREGTVVGCPREKCKKYDCFSTQAAYEEVIYFHPSLSEYCIQYQPARLLSPRLSMRLSCKFLKLTCSNVLPCKIFLVNIKYVTQIFYRSLSVLLKIRR